MAWHGVIFVLRPIMHPHHAPLIADLVGSHVQFLRRMAAMRHHVLAGLESGTMGRPRRAVVYAAQSISHTGAKGVGAWGARVCPGSHCLQGWMLQEGAAYRTRPAQEGMLPPALPPWSPGGPPAAHPGAPSAFSRTFREFRVLFLARACQGWGQIPGGDSVVSLGPGG